MDILNVFFGAGIALISSIVTIIITHRFQSERERISRRNEVLHERISKIEDSASSLLALMDQLRLQLLKVYKIENNEDTQIRNEYEDFRDSFDELFFKGVYDLFIISPKLLSGKSLGNELVDCIISKLLANYKQFLELYAQLPKNLSENHIERWDTIINKLSMIEETQVDENINKDKDDFINNIFKDVMEGTKTDWYNLILEFDSEFREISILAREAYIELIAELDKIRMEL